MQNTPLSDKEWLGRLNRVISENIADATFKNLEAAEVLEISESTLRRQLFCITSKTPLAYIRQFRLQQAKKLMESQKYITVKEVALAVGFLKVDYFSQHYLALFRKRPHKILKHF